MKSPKNSDGFSVLHILLILVVIGIIGFTGWYVWHAKQAADKTLSDANKSSEYQTPEQKEKSSAFQLPADWTWYNGDGFKFAYPKAYGSFIPNGSTQYISAQPEPIYIEGSTDPISITLIDKGAVFETVKYGPELKFVDGEPIVQTVNLADDVNKAGAVYKGYLKAENVLKLNGDLRIYKLNGGDEGNVVHRYAFELDDKDFIINMPNFYDGEAMTCPDTGCKANDKALFEAFCANVLNSISKL